LPASRINGGDAGDSPYLIQNVFPPRVVKREFTLVASGHQQGSLAITLCQKLLEVIDFGQRGGANPGASSQLTEQCDQAFLEIQQAAGMDARHVGHARRP